MKPVLGFLSEDEIRMIHNSALEILSQVGMRFPSEEAFTLLREAGAEVFDTDRVKIPASLVEEAIEKAPKRKDVTLYARDPKKDVSFATHEPSLACMTMATNVYDPYTSERRPATNEDLARLTRLADEMPNVTVNGGLVTPQEVPGKVNDWYTWSTCLQNTTKHITGGVVGYRGVLDAIEMASLAVGSKEEFLKRPFISGWVLTLPPLGISPENLEAMMEMARWNIPSMLSSGPILGTTSPVTIAGTLAQAHAEILGCIVVAQLVNPGAPIVYTSFARGMDMKTANVSMACPEFAILKVAMSQMGLFLDMPIRMPSMLRDSKVLDAQAGFETGMVGGFTSMTADIMDSMQLDTDLVVDYADLVFCNDCMGAIKRLAREVVVDERTLAMDVIAEVGSDGNFLEQRHTVKNFRKEIWHPKIMDRENYDGWKKKGALDVQQASLNKVREIIETEREPLLASETVEAIDAIVEKARVDFCDD